LVEVVSWNEDLTVAGGKWEWEAVEPWMQDIG